MPHDVTVIQFEDWQLWYVDDTLDYSAHSMDEWDAFRLGVSLGTTLFSYVYVEDIFKGDYDRAHAVFGTGRDSPQSLEIAVGRMTKVESDRFLQAICRTVERMEKK